MMALSDIAVADIRETVAQTVHGQRGAVVAALAERYGVSVATVYRVAQVGGARAKRAVQKPEYRGWVETAVALAHQAPAPAPLDAAIQSGIESGALPAEAAEMPLATAHRVARELGLRPPARRGQRLHADYPMQAVQFDGSTSQYLTVGPPVEQASNLQQRQGPQGTLQQDWHLHLHHSGTPAGGYKNKPLAAHRLRLVVYGVWDMCTGYRRAVYTAARGENAADAITALVGMLAETGDAARPMHGVPDNLWSDQGALVKGGASRDLLGRLGMALVLGTPGNKQRMGGVEQGWRRLWQRFERSLFLCPEIVRDGITLSDLNARLCAYERQENARRPARVRVGGRVVSRSDAWAALTRRRAADNPLRRLPDNALATLHREAKRRIDGNGIVRWEGAEYECREWHQRWVIVRQALGGADELTLEDPQSGERAVARRYVARPYGVVRQVADTALDKLLAAEQAPVGADVYQRTDDRGQRADGKVVALGAAAADAMPLDNPLDASRYGSLEEAMADFQRLYPWPMSGADRAAVAAQIEADGYTREGVVELVNRVSKLTIGVNQ